MKQKKWTYARIVALVYLGLILTGALLLMLPIASRTRTATPFFQCLFTATSATCVTGLIVVDTACHWSLFGQIVLLLLIQIGGMGFMGAVVIFASVLRTRVNLAGRRLLFQASGGDNADFKTVAKSLVLTTLVIEGAGAVILSIRFIPESDFFHGIFYGIFHSISAFCNAGFDLMGRTSGAFSSLSSFVGDPVVNIVIMTLITLGGLGFFAISDMLTTKFSWKKFSLHTRCVLIVSGILTFGGAILLLILERNAAFADCSAGEKVWAALFQSVTARTAGFATVDLSRLSDGGSVFMSLLMVVGGSSASTAGGLKTTTFLIVLMGIWSQARNRQDVEILHRRIESSAVMRAWTVCAVYFAALFTAVLLLCAVEPFSLRELLFEAASALGTAGLTLGITSQLTVFSQVILILLMFAGKLGAMTLALALIERRNPTPSRHPVGNLLIG